MLQPLCEDPPVDGGSPSQRVSNTEGVSVSCATASQLWHYIDVIMTTVASQITSLTSVYSIVYSGADQRKHQSSATLAFVRGIHRDRWIPRKKGQLSRKCFHFMTSSWDWTHTRHPISGWSMWYEVQFAITALCPICRAISNIHSYLYNALLLFNFSGDKWTENAISELIVLWQVLYVNGLIKLPSRGHYTRMADYTL